jgi:sec-independent protein translocase protein TatB
MFDFAWTEIALIGVVALVAIGPKDLPVAIKTVAGMIKKARRMAGEFQGHFDEMVREANLGDVRSQIDEIRNFDVKGAIEKTIDSDGSIRSTFDNPVTPGWTPPASDTVVAPRADHVITAPEEMQAVTTDAVASAEMQPAVTDAVAPVEPPPAQCGAPAFIPPAIAHRQEAPAFIPPSATRS